MKKAFTTFLILLFFTYSLSAADGFYHTQGRRIIDRNGNEFIMKGLNIQSAAWIYDKDLPNTDLLSIENNDFVYSELAEIGANVVRLNLNARLFEDSNTTTANHTYDNKAAAFAAIDKVLDIADRYNIGVIIGMHRTFGVSMSDAGFDYSACFTTSNINKTASLWRAIAGYYADDRRIFGYDLLNEPHLHVENGQTLTDGIAIWQEAATLMINKIREVDTNHIIIVEKFNRMNGADGQSLPAINDYVLDDVADPANNLVLEFHDYSPWGYVTQKELDSLEAWVWGSDVYYGRVPGKLFQGYVSELWPPARYNTSEQNSWQLVESAILKMPEPGFSLANTSINVSQTELAENSVLYIDNFRIDEYDDDDNFIKTAYLQSYTSRRAVSNTTGGTVVLNDLSVCQDDIGGCLKINATGSYAISSDLPRNFRVDPTKKYKISFYAYGENIPEGTSIMGRLNYLAGTAGVDAVPYNVEYIEKLLEPYYNYGINNDVPVFIGEFGHLTNEIYWKAAAVDKYIDNYLEAIKKYKMNATYFTYYSKSNSADPGSGFRVRAANVPTTPVDDISTVRNETLYQLLKKYFKSY